MNRLNKIIAIEWISGSWKTTIAKTIANKLWLIHIWESFNFLNIDESFPDVDINSNEALNSNHNLLLDLEIRKNKQIISSILSSKDIILERTFLTLLYTELALKDLSKYSNYEVLKSKIDLLISSWKIILPDFIFFLKTNPNIAKERINDRFWETKHFFKDEKTLNSLYNNLFSIITDNNLLKNIEYEIIENNWKDDLAKVIEYVSNKFIDIIKK